MSEELRAIRAQEALADDVYESSQSDESDDSSNWFINALLSLAPAAQRCVNCGIPHSRRNVGHDSMSAFCTDVCHDAAMQ